MKIRTVKKPTFLDMGRYTVYVGFVRAGELFSLGLDDNVRDEMTKSRAKKAMIETIEHDPDLFLARHAGVHVVARGLSFVKGGIVLDHPSIADGAQSRATIRDEEAPDIILMVAFLITRDEKLLSYAAASKNVHAAAKDLSIAGQQGQLRPLEKAMAKHGAIEISETDKAKGMIPTETLLQFALAYHCGTSQGAGKALASYREHHMHDAAFLKAAPVAWEIALHVKDNPKLFKKAHAKLNTSHLRWPKGVIMPALYVYGQCLHQATPDAATDRKIDAFIARVADMLGDTRRYTGSLPNNVKELAESVFS